MISILTKLEEISARAEKATPGPWHYTPADELDDWMLHNSEFTFVKQDDSGVPVSTDDGEFIAHSRTDIPQLVAALRLAVEALEKRHEMLQKFFANALASNESEALAEIDKLLGGTEYALKETEAESIHTCPAECKKPACVEGRKLNALIKALRFYAHGKQWSRMGDGAYADIGKLAREALAKWEQK